VDASENSHFPGAGSDEYDVFSITLSTGTPARTSSPLGSHRNNETYCSVMTSTAPHTFVKFREVFKTVGSAYSGEIVVRSPTSAESVPTEFPWSCGTVTVTVPLELRSDVFVHVTVIV